ncbi:MAG TPA: branched-chain amino acid ABC transporter permease [Herpetosiphonaceae bacterium]|nr:branched-chain amino acid ABC transporter permease [Herpetosiphonaceae bacterium]
MSNILPVTVGAILLAGLYATMSYGLALIYGVMRIVNLSHAGVMMLAAYASLTLFRSFGLEPYLAPLVVVPLFFVLGMGLQRLIVRRITGAAPIVSLLLLFSIWLIMQNVAYVIWSSNTQSILRPYTTRSIHLDALDLTIGWLRLGVFVAGVVTLIALQFFLGRTYLGKAIRATTQDRDSARLVGINVDRISMIAFGLGIALSALAGSLFAMLLPFNPDFGRVLMLKSFAVIVLGGLTNFVGIAAGALLLALAEEWAVGVLGLQTSLKDLVSYSALVLVLILLPNGLPSLFARGPVGATKPAKPARRAGEGKPA